MTSAAKTKLARAALVVLVLVLGVGVFALLKGTRPSPKKQQLVEQAALVRVMPARAQQEQLRVRASGTVIPSKQVVVQPQVTGRMQWVSEDLVPGGRFQEGEKLLRIDPSDYLLQVKQSDSQVERAAVELQLEESRRAIAQREWEIIGEDARATDAGKTIALREPQLENAKVALEAAKSARQQARLAVSRTSIEAPFNSMVQSESVDIGQVVSPGMPLATLVGTDTFWVRVSIPVDRLAYVNVPGVNAKRGEGSHVTVWQDVGGRRVERDGYVVRLLGDLDPVGRMARLLVAIDDPLGIAPHPEDANSSEQTAVDDQAKGKSSETKAKMAEAEAEAENGGSLPILIGAFVHVVIDAKGLADVIEVPRVALREGNLVYVMDDAGKLDIREVEISWRRDASVLIKQGVTEGEKIVVSPLPNAVQGMKLRLRDSATPEKKGSP